MSNENAPIPNEATVTQTEPAIEAAPPAPAVETPSPAQRAEENHLAFVSEYSKQVPIEVFRANLRFTTRGLFVSQSFEPEVLKAFHDWYRRTHPDAPELSDTKLKRKLFGSEEPEAFYLVEGKTALYGVFVPANIGDPQRFRLPFYLGSPNPAKDTLHPSDPIFQSIPGLSVVQGREGTEVHLQLGDRRYSFSLEDVKRFRELAKESISVKKHHPEFDVSLSKSLQAFVGTLRASKPIKEAELELRPLRFSEQPQPPQRSARRDARGPRPPEYRSIAGLVFVLGDRGQLLQQYHLLGKNLYLFIRDEVAFSLARKTHGHIGSFDIHPRKSLHLGRFQAHGKRYELHGNALKGFVTDYAEGAGNKPALKARNVRAYLEDLIAIFQLAQPIERHKIQDYLSNSQKKGFNYYVNQQWLFVVSRKYEIMDCIARIGKNRR